MSLIRGNSLSIPLRDASVDLIVTSPPYFALRSYVDGGEHYDGQIGSEASPAEFLEALWAVTGEMTRVLKPSGVMFVNLGDKYVAGTSAGRPADSPARRAGLASGQAWHETDCRLSAAEAGCRTKFLMGLPWRYAIGCIDRLGLILRAEIVWSKPNPLPEAVRDRPRRSHEQWFMFTKEERYFTALDEIREAQQTGRGARPWSTEVDGSLAGSAGRWGESIGSQGLRGKRTSDQMNARNPLGKVPGSVWEIPSEQLLPPTVAWWAPGRMRWTGWGDWDDYATRRVLWDTAVSYASNGEPLLVGSPEHFAAFPQAWPRRLITGWSPSGICVACGEGRRPLVESEQIVHATNKGWRKNDPVLNDRHEIDGGYPKTSALALIVGYECACPDTSAATRPAVVLDPFAGTGTTVMVARALGRFGVGLDLSADYLRLARWRVHDSGHARKSEARVWADRQGVLFG